MGTEQVFIDCSMFIDGHLDTTQRIETNKTPGTIHFILWKPGSNMEATESMRRLPSNIDSRMEWQQA